MGAAINLPPWGKTEPPYLAPGRYMRQLEPVTGVEPIRRTISDQHKYFHRNISLSLFQDVEYVYIDFLNSMIFVFGDCEAMVSFPWTTGYS